MRVSQSYSSLPMSKSPTMEEYLEQTHPPPKASVVTPSPPTKKKHKHSVQNDHTTLDPYPQASSNNNAAISADEEAEEGLNNLNNNQNKEQDAFLSSFPPGYRFNPRDEELVQYYLRRKIIDEPLPPNKIMQVNLYRHNPETLAERYEAYGEKEWYFFTPRDRKYRNGHRPNRAAGDGYWKATGADRPIFSNGVKGQPIIGYRKALVFYRGKPPKGDKTNWIMHEYRVDRSRPITRRNENDMRLDNWVLCRIYKKIGNTNHKSQIQNLKDDYTDELVHASPENNEEETMNEEEAMNDQDDKTQVSVISNVYPHIIVHPSMESQTGYANYGYHYSGGQPVCSMVVRDQVQTISFNPDSSYTHGQMQFACGSSSAMNYQDPNFAPESMIYSKEKEKWTMQYPDQKHFDPGSQERGEKSDDADDHIWRQPIPSFQDNQVSQYMDDSSVDDHNLMFAYPSPFVSLENCFSSGNVLL